MSEPNLIRMSMEDFNAIPQNAVPRNVQEQDPWFESVQAIGFIMGAYCDKLVFKDEAVFGILFNQKNRRRASNGQRILYSLSVLDGELNNGGLTQFFWNCLDLIDDVSDVLKVLNLSDLSELYERAVECFLAKQEAWNELLQKHSDEPDWNAFQKSYEFFDLGWFDKEYDGLSSTMLKAVVDYVSENPEEFIES